MYIIRDREAGNIISKFTSYSDAAKELEAYEAEDKRNGEYTPDFYEIVGPFGVDNPSGDKPETILDDKTFMKEETKMKKERDLVENGTQDTVIGCHCYQYNGEYYAFYEDQRIRYTTAKTPDTEGMPVSVDWWVWKSDLPRVKCKECPFYAMCEYMESPAF